MISSVGKIKMNNLESANKIKYRELCKVETSIPIFSRDWWLDTTAGNNNWDVVTVEDGNGEIIGSLPYVIKKKYFFNLIVMLTLTKYMGAWIKYPDNQKYVNKLSHEKKILTDIITKLPDFDKFYQNFHHTLTNWLPFYWSGFRQTSNYTYILEDLSDTDKIWNEFSNNVRTDIRNAENKYGLEIRTDLNIDNFIEIYLQTFKRQSQKVPYTKHMIKKIDNVCLQKNVRQIFYAVDQKKNIHAAVYVIYDYSTAYYLLGGINTIYQYSSGNSLVIWEAIKYFQQICTSFDFEGGMIESIEHYFRSFGARQKQYFNITKTNSKILRLLAL